MKKSILLAMVLAVAACVGTSRPAKFYTLKPLNGATETYKSAKLVIGVEEVRVPDYLDRPQMVVRDDNQVELTFSEMNRWSEPLSAAMQQVLADDMALYLPQAVVKTKGYRSEGFDYVVWVELNRFDGSWNQKLVLNAWWSVFNKERKLVLRERADFEIPLGKGYDDLAVKESALTADLAKQIAAKVARLPK